MNSRQVLFQVYIIKFLFILTLNFAIYGIEASSPPNVINVHEGTTATLPCEYKHPDPDPPPSVIEWLRQGQQLPIYIKIGKYPPHMDPSFGALTYESLAKRVNAMAKGRMKVAPGTADLNIKRIEISDEGWYECRVIFLNKENEKKNLERSQTTESHPPFINGTWTKLVVTAPPVLTSAPPNTVTSREGEVLLLRCRATGRPTPVITWHKDGWPIKNGQDGIRLGDGELAVTLEKFHKGKYTCRAQNVEGQVEHTTSVYIQGAPVITEPPKNTTVKEVQDAMFKCRADGYPTNIEYSWFYNDVPVTSSKIRERVNALDDGTLIIYSPVADDKGTVTCRASNGFGKAPTASATLTVQFPARVHKMPSILYAGLGLKTELPCPAVAVPPVSTVTWRKNDQVINIEQNKRYSLGENGSLVLEDIQQRDAARYTCTPYNILGTMGESIGTRLIVRYPPYFTKNPKSTHEAEIGKPLVIQCQGSGDPPPHVSWIKLDDNGEEEEIQDAENRVSFENGNLTIDSVAKSDHGSWQCVLSNAVASVKTDVMVYVKYTTPHAVSNISVVTSKQSAQISWTPGYDGGYSQHFMIWYKRADMGDHSWQTQSVESFRKVATVSNLEPDTIYQFALLPENVLGSGQFSKTITAKTKEIPPPTPTKEPESVPPPSRMESHIKKESGLLLLMWQPPIDTTEKDLLGYVIEFRMLLAFDEEDVQEKTLENIEKEDNSQNLPLEESDKPNIEETETDGRSKRSLWNGIVYARAKREAPVVPPTVSPPITGISKPQERWSAWATLSPVGANETAFLVPADKLFRDQLYEFQVMALSQSAYSVPSVPITVSTKDLDVYPILLEPVPYASAATNPAIIAGVAAAVLFVVIVTVLTSIWCRHHKRRKSALDSATFTFGNLPDNGFDSRSRTKSESPSHKSVESKSSSKFRDEKLGPLAKLKKKMWKADVEVGNHYSSTEELVGLGRKVSTKQTSEVTEMDKNGQTLIRKISRASDGKFHVADKCKAPSNQAIDAEESELLMPQPQVPHKAGVISPSRSSELSHSVEWDPRSPLLQHTPRETPVPENGSESLEIDCSHSDIEVRYVKDGRGRVRCQSTSMSSLSGPRQYNTHGRQVIPYEPHLDSSYASSAEYHQSPAPYTRQSMVSPAPHMPPYAQYVHLRPDNRKMHPEYRVSSPPRLTDYNPTPASPPKYRYHKHSDQPGGHYHVSPRDSYTNPSERLVFDPRYTRIEPIYEVGPHPNIPPNRHSSFVIDTRRELPHHSQPHRAIQIYRTTGAPKDGVNYPKPLWHDQSASRYHTLPHQPQMVQMSHAGAPRHHSDLDNVEASLIRHNANAAPYSTTAGDIRGPPSTTNTNSLGRSRRKSHEKETDSPRRRVCSVDDLTRENPLPANTAHVTERSESLDLLSSRQTKMSNSNTPPTSQPDKDRTRDGSDSGDHGSDVTTTSSSTNSEKLPRGVLTSRHSDLREENTLPEQQVDVTKVVITNPTSPVREDDSSAVSSLPPPTEPVIHNGRQLEVTSSGYDSHNTSHASDSPAPSCSSPNVITNRTSSCHDRTSTASSSDRSRKDTSSVDEKYEWDSEFAMESEILEALRHFGTHKRTGSVSQALVDEIQKLGMDSVQELGKDDLANLEKTILDHRDNLVQSPSVDTSDMYTKESMERRCAALKKEYQKYQLEQVSLGKKNPTSPDKSSPAIFATAPTNT
uniref:roundabout homolog 1-like isoform X1 n=1 Tax=Styela clava TaxID=7725 RepID=UPI00193A124B|nr:roundabout homolog 1-like isoform X1 [Styela clava]